VGFYQPRPWGREFFGKNDQSPLGLGWGKFKFLSKKVSESYPEKAAQDLLPASALAIGVAPAATPPGMAQAAAPGAVLFGDQRVRPFKNSIIYGPLNGLFDKA
jgi:hypothetical protein